MKMKLHEQQPRLSHFGLRGALLKIHSDLLKIHGFVWAYSAHYPEYLTNFEKMVLVLEDRRFMKHCGFDLRSVAREIIRALFGQRHGGASTIDMQFVRTATGYRERTIKRKIYEMILSVIIQYRYNKIVILRSYLNCAFFGSRLTGADAAASKMFGKCADDLSIDDAAFLASMLVYPRPMNSNKIWRSRVERRARYGMSVYIANKKSFDKFVS